MRFMRLASLAIAAAALVMLSSCTAKKEAPPAPDRESPATLRDLIYGEGLEENQYTVYIQEDGKETPFLVLTDQYSKDGYCLLLRKYVRDEVRVFNPSKSWPRAPTSPEEERMFSHPEYPGKLAYYPGSAIDHYLTEEYVQLLPEAVQDILCTAEIEVTQESSLGRSRADTEKIQRTAFLLSMAEVGGVTGQITPKEGRKLAYFFEQAQRSADTDSGKSMDWWLRTPHTLYVFMVCFIDRHGMQQMAGLNGMTKAKDGTWNVYGGVRPALCLDPETAIEQKNGRFYLKLE